MSLDLACCFASSPSLTRGQCIAFSESAVFGWLCSEEMASSRRSETATLNRTGAARDVISTASVVLDHRRIDSFGKITSQTEPTVDYDQFFSDLSYDADSQLYYGRARWYDPVGRKFIGEDPLRFGAGDTKLSRYSANDPVNFSDPNGLSRLSNAFKHVTNAFEDVGHCVENQWDNANIQKGLLVAGTLASGGMLGFGLAAVTLGTAQFSTTPTRPGGPETVETNDRSPTIREG